MITKQILVIKLYTRQTRPCRAGCSVSFWSGVENAKSRAMSCMDHGSGALARHGAAECGCRADMQGMLQVLLTNDLAGSTPAADPTPAESALQPRQQQVHQHRQGLLLLLFNTANAAVRAVLSAVGPAVFMMHGDMAGGSGAPNAAALGVPVVPVP